jgi:hypothetical protein
VLTKTAKDALRRLRRGCLLRCFGQVVALLHDQARGHGPVYLPLDYRSPWRTAVGDAVRTAGCSLSVYDPR